jgi:hypothetical protein
MGLTPDARSGGLLARWQGAPASAVWLLVAVGVAGGVLSGGLSAPELVVAPALGLAALALALARPSWAFGALVLLLPVRGLPLNASGPGFSFFVHPYRLVLLLLFLAIAVRAPVGWHRRLVRAPLTYPILLFTALAFASVFYALSAGLWVKQMLQMLVCLGVYVVTMVLVSDRRRFEATCKLLALTGLVHAVYGVVDYLMFLKGLPSLTLPPQLGAFIDPPRAQGLMDDPNGFMTVLLCALPLTVAWSLTFPRGLGRHLWAVAAVLDIALLPMTASRGGALATALLLLTAVGLSLSRRNYLAEPALGRLWRRLALLGVGVGTLAFVITLVVSPPHVVRLVRTFDLAGTAGVGAGRLMLYQRVLENVPRYPLGLGLGSILSPAAGFGNFAHNTFLQILAELGIPGVLLYLWLVFETLRAAARHHAGTTYSVWLVSVSLGLLSTYYAGLTLSMYYDEFFALFWGLLMVGNRLAEEELAARRRAEDTALIPAPAS